MKLTKNIVIQKYKNGEGVKYKDLPAELRQDLEIYLWANKTNKLAYKYAVGDDILRNKEIILNAIGITHFNYKYIPDDLILDKDFNLLLATKNPSTYKLMSPELQKDEEIFIKVSAFLSEEEVKDYIKQYFFNNKNVLLDVLETGMRIGVSIFSNDLKKDKELLKSIVNIRPEALPYFSKEIVESDDVFEMWIKKDLNTIVYFDYKEKNLELYKQACVKNKSLFTFLPEEVRSNKILVMDLLTNYSDIIFSKTIIEALGEKLKKDRDIFLLLAESKNIMYFDSLLPEELYDDIEILKTYVSNKYFNPNKTSFVKALHKHEEVVRLLLDKDRLSYKMLSEELMNSLELNDKLLERNHLNYSVISYEMKKNKNFIKKYATLNDNSFKFVPIEIKKDIPFMLDLLSENVGLMPLMLPEVRMNREVLETYKIFFKNQKYRYPNECDEIKKIEREERLLDILKKESETKNSKKRKI